MSGLQFGNSTNFRNQSVPTSTNDDNVVILENKSNSVSPNKNKIGFNSRPQFNVNTSNEGRRVKIKPTLGSLDFQSMANPRRNHDKSDDESESDEEDIDLSDDNDNNDNNDGDDNMNINMPDFSNTNMDQNLSDNHSIHDDQSSGGEEVSSDEEEGHNGEYDYSQQEFQNDDQVPQEEEEYKEPVPKKTDNFPDTAPKDYRERTRLKQELMYKLIRLEKSGYQLSRRLTMASSYDDLLFEFRRLNKQRAVESSIKFYRKILMLIVSGTEKANNRWDPLNIKLDGWSENTMENIHDYDEVFEELHEKYSGSVQMPPELKLMLMVVGSGFMFHLTNSLFKTVDPDIRDLIRNNPDIAASISKQAMNKMNEKMGVGDDDPLMGAVRSAVNMTNNKRGGGSRTFDVPRPQRNMDVERPRSSKSDMEEVDNILNSLENNEPVQSSNIRNGVRLNL